MFVDHSLPNKWGQCHQSPNQGPDRRKRACDMSVSSGDAALLTTPTSGMTDTRAARVSRLALLSPRRRNNSQLMHLHTLRLVRILVPARLLPLDPCWQGRFLPTYLAKGLRDACMA